MNIITWSEFSELQQGSKHVHRIPSFEQKSFELYYNPAVVTSVEKVHSVVWGIFPSSLLRRVDKTLFIKQNFVFDHLPTLEGETGAETILLLLQSRGQVFKPFPTLSV